MRLLPTTTWSSLALVANQSYQKTGKNEAVSRIAPHQLRKINGLQPSEGLAGKLCHKEVGSSKWSSLLDEDIQEIMW